MIVRISDEWWKPRCDILEEYGKLRVEFEVPGLSLKCVSFVSDKIVSLGVPSEAIVLTVTEKTLTLQSVKQQTFGERRGTYYSRER